MKARARRSSESSVPSSSTSARRKANSLAKNGMAKIATLKSKARSIRPQEINAIKSEIDRLDRKERNLKQRERDVRRIENEQNARNLARRKSTGDGLFRKAGAAGGTAGEGESAADTFPVRPPPRLTPMYIGADSNSDEDDWESQPLTLSEKLRAAMQQISVLKEQLRLFQGKAESKEQESESKTSDADLAQLLESAEERANEANRICESHRVRIGYLEKHIEKLETGDGGAAEREALRKRLEDAETRESLLQKRCNQVEEHRKSLASELARLREEMSKDKDEEGDSKEEDLDVPNKLQVELERLQSQLVALERERARFKQERDDLKAARDRSVEEQKKALEDQENIRSKLLEAEAAGRELETRLRQLENANDQLQTGMEKAKSDLGVAQRSREDLAAQLRDANDTHRQEIDKSLRTLREKYEK